MNEPLIDWSARVAEDDRGIGVGGNQQARWAGDDKLWIQFLYLPMINNEKSNAEGRPIFDDVEHVRILQPGNKESIVVRPVDDMDRRRFRKQYEDWKADRDRPREGTPLDQWPVLTKGQVEELRYFHVTTVEDLANLSDSNAQKFAGINMLRRQAQAFVEQAKEGAAAQKLATELEQRDNEITSLKQAIEEQSRMIQALNAKLFIEPPAVEATMPQMPKRGPSRPRKEG